MNGIKRSHRICLAAYGAMSLGGAALHAVWHWTARALPEVAGLTAAQWGLLAIMNWCIVMVLGALGALAFGMARSRSLSPRLVGRVSGCLAAFWLGRFVLELIYPVQVPLLGPETSLWIKLSAVTAMTLLLVPTLGLIPAGRPRPGVA